MSMKMTALGAALCVATGAIALANNASSATIVVSVTGLENSSGEVGCGLHSRPTEFPLGHQGAVNTRVSAKNPEVECVFRDVPNGTYATAVGHDENRNGKADTNFIGLPLEAWGVSGNVRPFLRPPTFEEAAFTVNGADVSLAIEVGQ